MKYTLKSTDKKLEGLRVSELEASGAKVCVCAENSLYEVEFRKDGVVISGGKVGGTPVAAQIHGTGALFGRTLYTDRIDSCGALEFNGCRTGPISKVTIETSKSVLRKALFDYMKGQPF